MTPGEIEYEFNKYAKNHDYNDNKLYMSKDFKYSQIIIKKGTKYYYNFDQDEKDRQQKELEKMLATYSSNVRKLEDFKYHLILTVEAGYEHVIGTLIQKLHNDSVFILFGVGSLLLFVKDDKTLRHKSLDTINQVIHKYNKNNMKKKQS